MTREEAMLAYIDAVNVREVDEDAKRKVCEALEALQPFMVNGQIPEDLHLLGRKRIMGQI